MAAAQFIEPRINECDINDWQALLTRTTEQMRGYIMIGLNDILNNSAQPVILAGSRFELNGALYELTENEAPGNAPTGTSYLYASQAGDTAVFSYSATAPTWNTQKQGWYNLEHRALAKITSGKKILLENFYSMYLKDYLGEEYLW